MNHEKNFGSLPFYRTHPIINSLRGQYTILGLMRKKVYFLIVCQDNDDGLLLLQIPVNLIENPIGPVTQIEIYQKNEILTLKPLKTIGTKYDFTIPFAAAIYYIFRITGISKPSTYIRLLMNHPYEIAIAFTLEKDQLLILYTVNGLVLRQYSPQIEIAAANEWIDVQKHPEKYHFRMLPLGDILVEI